MEHTTEDIVEKEMTNELLTQEVDGPEAEDKDPVCEVDDGVEDIEDEGTEVGTEPASEIEEGEMEAKTFSFEATEVKAIERDGMKLGIVAGYASTFNNVDRGRDKVMEGAFKSTIARHVSKDRHVRMYYQHDNKEIIGGFPASKMREDMKGLYVEGEINLEVQRGREVFALAKQGVLSDFSIGYSVIDFNMEHGVRELKEVELWEVSVVSEPMNPEATITEIKKSLNTKRDVEKGLRDLGLSRSQAVFFASIVDETKLHKDSDAGEVSSMETEQKTVTEEISEADEVQTKTNDLLRQTSELIKALKG
jgi:HK97 family phage prohead protease